MPIWRKAVNLLLKEPIALLFGAHLFYTEGDKDIDRGGHHHEQRKSATRIL